MKKFLCSSLLAATLILFGNHKATAQCGSTGANAFYCSAYSGFTQDVVTQYGQWVTNAPGFTISVNLQIFNELDPQRNAYASVAFGNYGWSQGINESYYEDNFFASATQVENVILFTTAKAGSAYIGVEW